ncbi:hypothetical protein BLX24_22660 [Arsenicibacter rosenii]|uniref:MPN domain-containing protein n=1 Tax=Arsenicibacter rosenii TaxID=1750698 RepID=A0A1S2VG39_9BACT|nr:hypothetical protein BLX24_22660 [Arsenicibacter rosenii]
MEKILGVGEITVRYCPDLTRPRIRIVSSVSAYEVISTHWVKDAIAHREDFCILCLNRANEVIGYYRVSQGGVSGTVADPKIIFQVALGCHASGIILAHNHPSCNLQPSQADKDLTYKLKQVGKFLDCPVLDHIILTPDQRYFSFADEGIL